MFNLSVFVFAFVYSVYILLFNKCIYENIAVLNNEIMSFKMGSKGPLSLKTNPWNTGYELSMDT